MTRAELPVSIDEVQAAAASLRGLVVRTPLLPFRPGLLLKPESLQPVGSFKIRGAYTALAALTPDRRVAGVVAHSSGNHAQGVARAARLLGIDAVVVMPRTAPAVKIERVRADGARVVLVGPSSEARVRRAREIAAHEGRELVDSHDDPRVIAGQGTVGLEIVEQLAASDPAVAPGGPPVIVVPVGGGGLAAGVCVAATALLPGARVVGVQPRLGAHARDSLTAGRIVAWSAARMGRTIADGQRVARLGAIPFTILSQRLADLVVVEEDEIERAMAVGLREARLVLEPSGATSLAAALFHPAKVGLGGWCQTRVLNA